jgi:hypothetical protein
VEGGGWRVVGLRLRLRVFRSGFRVEGMRLGVKRLGFRIKGHDFRVKRFGFRV